MADELRGAPMEYSSVELPTKERQELLLNAMESATSISEALRTAGVNSSTAYRWRDNDPEFAIRWFPALQNIRRMEKARTRAINSTVFDPNRPKPPKAGFIEWRRTYIGRDTPDHHVPVVAALEDRTNLTVIVLGPAGSGKDTIAGDWVLYEACDGFLRVGWVMESKDFAQRRIDSRIDPYLTDPKVYDYTPEGPGSRKPERSLIDDYGPFRWTSNLVHPDNTPVPRRRWTQNEKYFLRSDAPEADPNLWAVGLEGTIYGSRIDLLVGSDLFTMENQKSPTDRRNGFTQLIGTIDSRLDQRGRMFIIGHRVLPEDNYGLLLDRYTEGARVVKTDGYYTKYSNGTATVIYPAIQVDPDTGEEVSYWPEMFPLKSKLVVVRDARANGRKFKERVEVDPDGLDDDELEDLVAEGAHRERGLAERRIKMGEIFNALYQQNPTSSLHAEFTDDILDFCDDEERTVGSWLPGSQRILGVDPARAGGAAWVLWEKMGDVFTVVDCFWGKGLGITGIKDQLIAGPVRQYLPDWMAYEINRHEGLLDHPDVAELVRSTGVKVHKHPTHAYNRANVELSVSSMVPRMRAGQIRFPARTAADREKMRMLKEHFKTWDRKTALREDGGGSWRHLEDDLAMAAWVGWRKGQQLDEINQRTMPKPYVPPIVAARWGRMPQTPRKVNVEMPPTDLVALWVGDD